MDANPSDELQSSVPHLATPGREVRRTRRKPARGSDQTSKANLSQVSLYVPRELLASFDDFSAAAGVNRSHLIREALAAYAAMLDAGCRVYQVPGLERNERRAA